VFIGISQYKISIFFRKVFVDNIEIIIHYKVIFTVCLNGSQSTTLSDRLLLIRCSDLQNYKSSPLLLLLDGPNSDYPDCLRVLSVYITVHSHC